MRYYHFLALLLALVLSGCPGGGTRLLPYTADLTAVHNIYREEFISAPLNAPEPKVKPDVSPEGAQNRVAESRLPTFRRTLQAIRDFRVKYGSEASDRKKEFAHLTVLEGMVYLQSGHFGSAKALKQDVEMASGNLTSATGRAIRDQLFAQAFGDLVTGWEQLFRKTADRDKLMRAAKGIEGVLEDNKSKIISSPDADGGAIYLATTAGIFWIWVHELYSSDCDVESERCDQTIKDNLASKEYYDNACALMGLFLSGTEKKAARELQPVDWNKADGRLRYMQWYSWLHEQQATCPQ